METGSNMESKAAASASDEAMTSPVPPDLVAAAAAGGAAGEDEVTPAAAAGEESTPAAPAASPKPYYECVFCKRGFTTAQALGGHMNIHRRDRAKPPTRDSPVAGITTVSWSVDCYTKYHLLGTYRPPAAQSIPIPIGAGSSFGMYYTSSAGAAAGALLDAEGGNPTNSVSPRELSLFGGEANRDQDMHLGLGRHGHIVVGEGSRAPAEGRRSSERQESGEPERELDLELRLGRCPRRH